MAFERYIPELKKYDSILFLYQPITSGQPLKIVQRHMAHPVYSKDIHCAAEKGFVIWAKLNRRSSAEPNVQSVTNACKGFSFFPTALL